MARCGCGSSCSCLITAGDGTRVDGIGTVENPYVISSDASQLLEQLEFNDTGTIDFSVIGLGTLGSPMEVSAVARLAMTDLIDVQGSPELSQVPVWVGDHWEFQDQSGGGGGGSGLPDGGVAGQVLVKQSATDGDADWETSVADYVILRTATQQTMASATEVSMVFDPAQSTDPLGMFDGTSLVTVQRAGVYEITMNASFAAVATPAGSRIVVLRLGGTTVKQWYETVVANQPVFATHTVVVALAAGTTIQFRQYQSQGTNLNTYGSQVAVNPSLYVTRVGDLIGGTPLPDPVMGEQNYAALRKQTAALVVANATQVPVPWDTVEVDGGIAYANPLFTVPVAGYYNILAEVIFPPNATGYRQIRVLVNGTLMAASNMPAGSGGETTAVLAKTVLLAAGDTLQFNVFQTSTASMTITASAVNNFVSIAKVPAPVVPGRAASGVWGSPPLDVFGTDPQAGDPIYVDAAGQLRSRPQAIAANSLAASVLHTTYPVGVSVMDLDQTFAAANGWLGTSHVMTVRRGAGTSAFQLQSLFSTAGTLLRYRQSGALNAWGPWVSVVGDGQQQKMACGRGSVTFTAGVVSATTTVTFPAGLFTVAPTVSLTTIGSSQVAFMTTSSPVAGSMAVIGRQIDNTPLTGTFSFDWIAVQSLN